MEPVIDRIDTLTKALAKQRLCTIMATDVFKARPCGYAEREAVREDAADWEGFPADACWGGLDAHFCFRAGIPIPQADGGRVICRISTDAAGGWSRENPQFIAYIDGEMVCGLDEHHREFEILHPRGGKAELALYAYCNTPRRKLFLRAETAVLCEDVERLYYDLRVPFEAARLMDGGDRDRIKTLDVLLRAVNLLDFRKPQSEGFFKSVREAQALMQREYYEKLCGKESAMMHCVGHTHIDVAWLWPLEQTREKALRSFSTVVHLMSRYPEYRFMSSQPQLYQFVKEDCPALYQEIKALAAQGRWEAEGAMWLEADCNLTSGESLVRQILYGKRFFKEEFGVDSRLLWLPDVFGYSAAMPQILKKSGVDYFMTTKIGWNESNRIPYDTLMWEGIDGSQVLTHFITARDYDKHPDLNPCPANSTTYNGILAPNQVMGGWQRYQNKGLSDDILMCYGYGDGGGGPTAQMLENSRRLSRGLPGCPAVRQSSAAGFFDKLAENVRQSRALAVWRGELYLEFHRGTYTSMAANKKLNRQSENQNRDAELYSVLQMALRTGLPYPRQALRQCWETTMLNQFHDILPGSAIGQVYEQSHKQYRESLARSAGIIAAAQERLAAEITLAQESAVVFNSLPFARTQPVSIPAPGGAAVYDGDIRLPSQRSQSGALLFLAPDVPSMGYKAFSIRPDAGEGAGGAQTARFDGRTLETPFYRAEFDGQGAFRALYDRRADRPVLMPGERGNVLQVFEDRPSNYDAWNIDSTFEEKMWEISALQSLELLENGPVRAVVRLVWAFLDSTVRQDIHFYRHSARIDFATHIDWRQEKLLLKAAFPVQVRAPRASYEIQFGCVERSTNANTSWEKAQFEVCAQRWASLSEDGYGVALMNDCKYGYDIKGSLMRLTLLKSATDPYPDADKGAHDFTYALFPYCGTLRQGGVVRQAQALNVPLVPVVSDAHPGRLPAARAFLQADSDAVAIDTVKKAEDSGKIIVRLYEAHGGRGRVRVRQRLGRLQRVEECDLMEQVQRAVPAALDGFSFDIAPFEIRTFALSFS